MAPFRLPGRWLPPAYTPIPLGGLVRAFTAVALRRDDRDRLAELLGDMYEADSVVLTDSGTSALQLAIREVGSTEGSERSRIALPAFACFDLVTALVGADAVPVFYDMVPETLEPEWSSFRAALEAGVDGVVVAPLFGLPGGWPKVRALADAAGVPIIEDAAQGFGSFPGGRRAGTLGEVSVLSFGRGKGWTGSGGGALLRRNGHRGRGRPRGSDSGSFGPLVRGAAQRTLSSPAWYGLPARIPALGLGETRYHPPESVSSLPRASATLLLTSLDAAGREAELRREKAKRLVEGIDAGHSAAWSPESGYLRLPLLLPDTSDPSLFCRNHRRLGVLRSYPTPLPLLPAIRDRESIECNGPWTGAQSLADRLVTLPTHSLVSEMEIRRLIDSTRAAGGRVVGPTDE